MSPSKLITGSIRRQRAEGAAQRRTDEPVINIEVCV